jgi:hypothetical protein
MPAQPSRTPFDPEDPKRDDRAAPPEDSHLANRTHREADHDDELEEVGLSGDDLVELDLDDLKDMEGPDA